MVRLEHASLMTTILLVVPVLVITTLRLPNDMNVLLWSRSASGSEIRLLTTLVVSTTTDQAFAVIVRVYSSTHTKPRVISYRSRFKCRPPRPRTSSARALDSAALGGKARSQARPVSAHVSQASEVLLVKPILRCHPTGSALQAAPSDLVTSVPLSMTGILTKWLRSLECDIDDRVTRGM